MVCLSFFNYLGLDTKRLIDRRDEIRVRIHRGNLVKLFAAFSDKMLFMTTLLFLPLDLGILLGILEGLARVVVGIVAHVCLFVWGQKRRNDQYKELFLLEREI